MNDLIDDPRVVAYRRQLDAVLGRLPAKEAALLRDQIDAHLREALAGDHDGEDVEDVLRRLGPPDLLLPEPSNPPGLRQWVLIGVRRIRSMPTRRIAALVTGLLVAAAAVGVGVDYLAAPSLSYDGLVSGWWYPVDSRHATSHTAGDVTQQTAIMRFGHQQGFVITIRNPSRWPQTVLGPNPHEVSLGASPLQVAVAVPPVNMLGLATQLHYAHHVTIPPHHRALLRLLWRTNDCFSPGAGATTNSVSLRVRIGPVTRSEHISFGNDYWALVAPADAPNPPKCPL